MIRSAPIAAPRRRPPDVGGAQRRIWGCAPAELYERYWALHRIQVVRPGSRVESRGPILYLLCARHECLFFDLAPLSRTLNRLKPRILRLRICDAQRQEYREVVVADSSDRLVAIRRQYRAGGEVARAWLTPDRALAELWSRGDQNVATVRAIKAAVRSRSSGMISTTCSGRILSLRDKDQTREFLRALQQRWRNPGLAIDGVFEFQPGVWMHERSRVPPGLRFAGTVWIGAGPVPASPDLVIGPDVFDDTTPEPLASQPIAWEAAAILSHYRPAPRGGRRRIDLAAKRGFDIIFSLLVLLATAPLYPLITLAIWLEDGWPPLFAHTRQTVGGRSFPCYKFRTMCRNAESLKARLIASNVCDGPQFYIADDPRVLRVGRILRKFQLDELPQFWNVLLGHMSVVGPRPSPDKENQFCPTWREARLSVRPGVTGLWQVRRTRAPETDFQEWIRYDLEYVQHASWKLDLWIIVQTIRRVLAR
jgi:lipopolysaccharide/colanic/teichoic acid biosynthesis glycosyltransferase